MDKGVEGALKGAVGRWQRGLRLPPPPAIPSFMEGSNPDTRLLWELNERVKLLEEHYRVMGKVVWRTSAAVLGLLVPSLGWDVVNNLLKLMGS